MIAAKKLFYTKVFLGQLSITSKKNFPKIFIFKILKVVMKKWGNSGQAERASQHI